jgi:hypothetical protein
MTKLFFEVSFTAAWALARSHAVNLPADDEVSPLLVA